MQKFHIADSDGIFQGPYTVEVCQLFMDMYGTYEGKKPFPIQEIFLDRVVGKTELKDLRKRVKDSCKEIRKVYRSMVPKYYRHDLPDEDI